MIQINDMFTAQSKKVRKVVLHRTSGHNTVLDAGLWRGAVGRYSGPAGSLDTGRTVVGALASHAHSRVHSNKAVRWRGELMNGRSGRIDTADKTLCKHYTIWYGPNGRKRFQWQRDRPMPAKFETRFRNTLIGSLVGSGSDEIFTWSKYIHLSSIINTVHESIRCFTTLTKCWLVTHYFLDFLFLEILSLFYGYRLAYKNITDQRLYFYESFKHYSAKQVLIFFCFAW